jgi:glycosyltransferase involved in cell wall biosynthesis
MRSISIAVIICHYEQFEELSQALRSVACQLRTADQIVVVDDGSPHPPKQADLEKFCSTPVTLLLNQHNHGGPAIPRNQAIQACHCSHLAFLDADDILLPHTLGALESVWTSHPSAIAYGDQICWGPEIKRPFLQHALRSSVDRLTGSRELYDQLLMGGNRLFLSGSGGPTELFASHPFDPQQRWEDYDVWLRLAHSGQQFQHSKRVHTLYRLQHGSRSGSRRARHQGCEGIHRNHLQNRAWWSWPLWYWKQRVL